MYVHHGKTTFDTKLGLEFLQEYFIITLDVFKENQYSKEKSTQNAWLSLFTAESVDDLERLVAEYPWMAGICQEMADYLYKNRRRCCVCFPKRYGYWTIIPHSIW